MEVSGQLHAPAVLSSRESPPVPVGQNQLSCILGRTIAQAVSRRLPTAAARVGAQVRSCGICGGQNDTRAGFLQALQFPQPILIPPTAPHSSSIIRGWYNRPINALRTSGLSLTSPQESKRTELNVPMTVIFEKLTVGQLVKKSKYGVVFTRTLPGPYPEPHESQPYVRSLFL
jgi:hypothetical protein